MPIRFPTYAAAAGLGGRRLHAAGCLWLWWAPESHGVPAFQVLGLCPAARPRPQMLESCRTGMRSRHPLGRGIFAAKQRDASFNRFTVETGRSAVNPPHIQGTE